MNQDNSNKFISAIPVFSLQAANDVHTVSSLLSKRLDTSGFLKDELLAIREALYPYGGTTILSDITFNGVSTGGQRLDIYTPISGGRTDSHILALSKVAVMGSESSYKVEHVPTGATLPSNKFSTMLKMLNAFLENSHPVRSSQPNNSYNG